MRSCRDELGERASRTSNGWIDDVSAAGRRPSIAGTTKIRLEALTGRQFQLARPQSQLSKTFGGKVRMQCERQLENDALVPMGGSGRHQQFAVYQLVPRRESRSLVEQSIDSLDRPHLRAQCWHEHKLLGGWTVSQLGLPEDAAPLDWRYRLRSLAIVLWPASRTSGTPLGRVGSRRPS